jgi:hypothetical protein
VFFPEESDLLPESWSEFLLYITSPGLELRSELRNGLIDLAGIVSSLPIMVVVETLRMTIL